LSSWAVIALVSAAVTALVSIFDKTIIFRYARTRLTLPLLIGLAQTLALIPGTSRSGITITAARALGFEREDAARISLLLSIPIILAAGGYQSLEVVQSGQMALGLDALLAAALAFAAALLAVALMMRWLRHASYTPFVVYRLLLGAGLLYWLYG